MRLIGHLENELSATNFVDFLYGQGIQSRVEGERDGAWAIWVYDEEQISAARNLLSQFQQNPGGSSFQDEIQKARQQRAKYEEKARKPRGRVLGREDLVRSGYGAGPLTVALILISVGVAFVSSLGQDMNILHRWFISGVGRGLPEVRSGEIWRLWTPMFLHFGPVHLLFNMFWLYDLGSMIEGRLRTARLAILVAVLSLVSNLAQYLVTANPGFGGMSGVVYGLLGYIWIRGKLDPGSGLYLHPHIVTMMIVWFFLCFSGLLEVFFNMRVANTAHAAGLILGMLWGFLEARAAGSKRGIWG